MSLRYSSNQVSLAAAAGCLWTMWLNEFLFNKTQQCWNASRHSKYLSCDNADGLEVPVLAGVKFKAGEQFILMFTRVCDNNKFQKQVM